MAGDPVSPHVGDDGDGDLVAHRPTLQHIDQLPEVDHHLVPADACSSRSSRSSGINGGLPDECDSEHSTGESDSSGGPPMTRMWANGHLRPGQVPSSVHTALAVEALVAAGRLSAPSGAPLPPEDDDDAIFQGTLRRPAAPGQSFSAAEEGARVPAGEAAASPQWGEVASSSELRPPPPPPPVWRPHRSSEARARRTARRAAGLWGPATGASRYRRGTMGPTGSVVQYSERVPCQSQGDHIMSEVLIFEERLKCLRQFQRYCTAAPRQPSRQPLIGE